MRKPEYKLGIKLYTMSMIGATFMGLVSGWYWRDILAVMGVVTAGTVLLMIAEWYKTR